MLRSRKNSVHELLGTGVTATAQPTTIWRAFKDFTIPADTHLYASSLCHPLVAARSPTPVISRTANALTP